MENLSQRFKNVDWNNLKKHALKVRGEAASKLKDFCMTDIENKVRAATSNKSWGASTSELFEIAQATFNNEEYPLIMAIVWQRLNDHGRNWRHVYKALELLRYLIMHGSSRVIDEVQDALYHIRSLQDFRYIDSVTHKDEGANVRMKAKQVIDLVSDERLLQEERQKSKELYLKVANSGGASRFGGISSSDIYAGYDRDYVSGSEVAAGGRYSNTYEYFEAANEPVSSQNQDEVRFSGSEEGNELSREAFTPYKEPSGHASARSSTLPGAVRIGSDSARLNSSQSHSGNLVSPPKKQSNDVVNDLISWDDSDSVVSSSKDKSAESDEMITWDSDFNPRGKETHSSTTAAKSNSPMDLLLETTLDSPTTTIPNANLRSAVPKGANTSSFVKESNMKGGFSGFATPPSNSRSESTQTDKNERLFSQESQGQAFSKKPSDKKTVHGTNNVNQAEQSHSKTSSSGAQAGMDPFDSLVTDFMSTKLGQKSSMKDFSKPSKAE